MELRYETIFEMLKIQHDSLKRANITPEIINSITSMTELYTLCLCSEIAMIGAHGLYKEYIRHNNEELSTPKGIINVTETVNRQSRLRTKIVCSYESLSDNVLHNQILKTTLTVLLHDTLISKEVQSKVKKANTELNGVDNIEVNSINFKNIRYNNSNIRYKTAIWICEMLLKNSKIRNNQEYKMFEAFKNHLYRFYKEEYKDKYSVSVVNMDYDMFATGDELNSHKRDKAVLLESKDKALMIKTCLYDKMASPNKIDVQLKSLKLAVLDNQLNTGKKTLGAIIYVNTDINYTDAELKIVNVDRIIMAYDAIDINIKHRYIVYKLKQIVKAMM